MITTRREYEKTRKAGIGLIFAKLAGWLLPVSFPFPARPWLLRLTGARVGKKVYIGRLCVFDDTFGELLTVEDGATISAGCIITCHDSSTPEGTVGSVAIRRGAYLGIGVRVLPGTVIGENAIVGAGAVVTRDVPPDAVVVGIPARPVERRGDARFARPSRGEEAP